MTTAQLVFLYAAEEHNISKAAARAFVSQQCASSHIKNLEGKYGIALFNRKPALSLTPAGECLLSSLRQLYILEKNMDARILEIREGSVGRLRVGLNPTRSRILIPRILERYSEEFPRVELSLHFDDTFKLLRMLESGKVDLVIGIGIQAPSAVNYRITPLSRDAIYFITTSRQILRYHPALSSRIGEPALSLHDLTPFPFCRNLEGSTLTRLVDSCLYREGIKLDTRYSASDYDTQIALCGENIAGAFCPSMILKRVLEYNRNVLPSGRILIFPVKEITGTLQVDLIQNITAFQPLYVEKFIERLSEVIGQIERELEGIGNEGK